MPEQDREDAATMRPLSLRRTMEGAGTGADRSRAPAVPAHCTPPEEKYTMSRMGNYCRAYHARDFAAYPGWHPDPAQLRPAGDDAQAPRALRDDDLLYLQEGFAVTDGIFADEHVVFADESPEWRAFCGVVLGFAPPAAAEVAA